MVVGFSALFPARFLRVKWAAFVLSRTKIKHTREAPDYLVARPALITSLHNALENSEYNTVLVYGQRGSGKTTAIEQTLRTRLGVLQWTLATDDGTAATTELYERWKRMFDPWTKPSDRDFELDACSSALKSQGKALVVVISVESSAKPAALKMYFIFA